MVVSTKVPRGIIITVCKYDYYQNPENYGGTDGGSKSDLRRSHGGTSILQEGKNDIQEKGFPSPSEITQYAKDNGYDLDGTRIYEYYRDLGFKDSRGNQIKNWKNKIRNVWFKPEHRINGTVAKINEYVPPAD